MLMKVRPVIHLTFSHYCQFNDYNYYYYNYNYENNNNYLPAANK